MQKFLRDCCNRREIELVLKYQIVDTKISLDIYRNTQKNIQKQKNTPDGECYQNNYTSGGDGVHDRESLIQKLNLKNYLGCRVICDSIKFMSDLSAKRFETREHEQGAQRMASSPESRVRWPGELGCRLLLLRFAGRVKG